MDFDCDANELRTEVFTTIEKINKSKKNKTVLIKKLYHLSMFITIKQSYLDIILIKAIYKIRLKYYFITAIIPESESILETLLRLTALAKFNVTIAFVFSNLISSVLVKIAVIPSLSSALLII